MFGDMGFSVASLLACIFRRVSKIAQSDY